MATAFEVEELTAAGGVVEVPRWGSEMPLFAIAVALAIPLWLLLIVSIIGAVYGLMIGLGLLMMHALLVYHVRANGVRVGPDQFPELHARVTEIAEQFGLERVPATYVMQAGGVLNAFATKFLGSNMMVVHSELLEATEGNTSARDMILGHELGHIRAGHLKWRWLIAPALFVPFLGSALSRAREYTSDRYGLVGARNRDGAQHGLIVLAAGGKLAQAVDPASFVAQQGELRGFWMTFANLMSSHPPLTTRVAALHAFRP